MTTVRNKSRYDKEMTAVTFNLKEQRVLEKSMQTLRLEKAYAMKLLELDNRIIKVHYKKLKERVSKIKSHLPPEDISKFRDLDQRGKLKSAVGGVSNNGAIKIAAASRRLNLGSEREERRRRCTKSAVPTISVTDGKDKQYSNNNNNNNSNSKQPEIGNLRRSNSVTGVFIDAPEPNKNIRPGSASVIVQPNAMAASERPKTAAVLSGLENPSTPPTPTIPTIPTTPVRVTERHRPTTSVHYSIESQGGPGTGHGHDDFLRKPALDKRPSTTPHHHHHHHQTHSLFSSHVTAEKEARSSSNGLPLSVRSATAAAADRGRKLSCISRDSIDSNLGDNMFEERRQELLEEESFRAATLGKKTQLFLKDVDDYLQKNPPLQPSHVAFESNPREPPRRDSFVDKEPRTPKPPRHLARRNDRPEGLDLSMPTFFPEDKYREKLLSLWTDLNKCRYLRLPDERMDLSGVNTLVKDNMKLFETLRHAETVPITDRSAEV